MIKAIEVLLDHGVPEERIMFLNLVRSPSALLATLSQAPSGQPPLDPSLAPPPSNPVSYPLLPTRAHSLSVTVQLILFAPPRFDRTD